MPTLPIVGEVDTAVLVAQLIFLLPELILAVTGTVIVAISPLLRGRERPLVFVAATGVLAAFAGLGPSVGGAGEVLARMLVLDGTSTFFRPVFMLGALIVIGLSPDYLARRQVPAGEFYALVLFATVGIMLMASTHELLMLYLGLELASISGYVLAGMLRSDARSQEASIKLFLIGAMGSAVLLFGLSLVYGITGSTNLVEIGHALTGGAAATFRPALLAATMFLVAGFGFKMAAVPFHMYVPDAYEGAPTPVAAFLSVGLEGAAFAAAIRVFVTGLGIIQPNWAAVFAVLALATMTLGNVTALLQQNVKRMMAYSSIAQAGYILVGLAVATDRGISAMLYYVLAYTVMNLGAWAALIYLSHNGQSEELADFAGLGRRAPLVAWALTFCFLSLIGIPPTAGFFGKFLLFSAAVDAGLFWLAVAMAVNSVISLGYYWNVVRAMFMEEPATEEPLKASPVFGLGFTLAVLGTLLIGLGAAPFFRLVSAAVVTLP